MKAKFGGFSLLILFLLILFFSGCDEINPFYAGGVLPGGNWIYYGMAQSIYKMRLDGSGKQLVVDTGLNPVDYIHDIQLDPFRRKIYFWCSTYIYSCNLDGTERKSLFGHEPAYPFAMTYNPVDGLLYFIYSDTSGIRTLDPVTLAVNPFYQNAVSSWASLAFDEDGKVYMLDNANYLTRIDGPTTATPLYPAPTVVTTSSRNLRFNRPTGMFFYVDGMDIHYVVKDSLVSGTMYTAAANINRIVPYSPESEVIYSHSGPPGVIRRVGMNGTGDTLLVSDSVLLADSFDILSK